MCVFGFTSSPQASLFQRRGNPRTPLLLTMATKPKSVALKRASLSESTDVVGNPHLVISDALASKTC